MAFETFDLSKVIATAEGIKGMRRQEETDKLRDMYLNTQIAGSQQAQGIQKQEADEEQMARQAKRNYYAAQAVEASDDPLGAARELAPEMVAAFEQKYGKGTFDSLPVDAVKKIAAMGKEKAAATAGINLRPDPNVIAQQQFAREMDSTNFSQQKQIIGMQREMTPYQRAQLELERRQLEQGTGVNNQLITRPVGNGLVQDFAWNPRTNQREPNGEPYRPVTPHTGNVTEGERKAAALGTRLEASLQALNALEKTAPGASRPGVLERGLEAVGAETLANTARSSDRQQADTAQLDALDAALSLATGAAYTAEQLKNLRKSYFPQIGDSESTVKAKQKRFETIVQTARIAAGRAEPSIDKAIGASGAQTSSAPTATGPNGQKLILQNGQWVPFGG